MMKHEIAKPNTCLYFAFGCNMLRKRMHMHSPTAEFVSIARLDVRVPVHWCGARQRIGERLDFIKYSKFWGGPAATMVPTANAHVWGVIWRIDNEDLPNIDIHKQVPTKIYYPLEVTALTPHMGEFLCRTYEQRVSPLPRGDNDPVPAEQWPSMTLKEVMILGATEHGLPDYYIEGLMRLQDNGEEGCLRLEEMTLRYAREPPCDCVVPGKIPRKPLKMRLADTKTPKS